MNRINQLFQEKPANILSVYFTAGYPRRDSTIRVARALANAGADMIEIGIPFSDPMADGPVIQESNRLALQNGMTLSLLLQQVATMRKEMGLPILLMGYLNPVLQYGMECFIRDAAHAGVDGLILPDLPADVYLAEYAHLFQQHGMKHVFLVTPQTSAARIHMIDACSDAFIYLVTASATTGSRQAFTSEQCTYFETVGSMKLNNPILAGFGISDKTSFDTVCDHLQGAIAGSSFIRALQSGAGDIDTIADDFIKQFKS